MAEEIEKPGGGVEDDARMTLIEHLEELRLRLMYSLIAVAVGFVICYAFRERIFVLLARPLFSAMKNDKLIFTSLTEPFFVYLKAAGVGGVMLALPVILYQVWRFVAPGLYAKERRLVLPLVFLSTLFFLGGASFGYFVVFPMGFSVLLNFAGSHMEALPSVKEYFSLAVLMLFAFGLIFELPLVIVAFVRFGLVSVTSLRKNRKYAILAFFIVGAILTPPDPLSQVAMAVPLCVLYELSILFAVFFERKKKREEEEAEAREEGSGADSV
ncbi:MAG: twin-arginine translocase subunit TatC [Thermodesulfobacteriota bacterium]